MSIVSITDMILSRMLYTDMKLAAEVAGVHLNTLKRWIAKGEIGAAPWDAEALAQTRMRMQRQRTERVIAAAHRRKKYKTPDEVSLARYQAVKRFRRENREKVNAEDRKSKALKRHPFWKVFVSEAQVYYGTKCLACGKEADCWDHVIPLSQQGSNAPSNLQPLCRSCNVSKKGLTTDYRPDQGRWAVIRWGGWKENGGRKATGPRRSKNGEARETEGGELVSVRWGGWHEQHAQSIEAWRFARERHGALLAPSVYKSSGFDSIKPPIRTVTDAGIGK